MAPRRPRRGRARAALVGCSWLALAGSAKTHAAGGSAARPADVAGGRPSAAGSTGARGPRLVARSAPATSPAGPLVWERAFPTSAARVDVHFVAHFRGSDGRSHRLEAWRHGESFLRRRTDDTLDLYVAASRPGGELSYRFIDHHRHLVTDVQRANLFRLGVVSDWFGLAHVLEHPRGAFSVVPASGHEVAPAANGGGACSWRALTKDAVGTQPAQDTRICWSAAWGLPLQVFQRTPEGSWREELAVERVERARGAPATWDLPAVPAGYGVVNADREIVPPPARGED